MSLKFTNPEDLKQKHYYLAGKMSGLKQFNIPKFFEVAQRLREMGYKITNPAELDSSACRMACLRSLTGDKSDLPNEESWGQIMGRDISFVIDTVDGVVVFDNWTESLGARLEVYTAYLLGKDIRIFREQRDGSIVVEEIDIKDIEEGILH